MQEGVTGTSTTAARASTAIPPRVPTPLPHRRPFVRRSLPSRIVGTAESAISAHDAQSLSAGRPQTGWRRGNGARVAGISTP